MNLERLLQLRVAVARFGEMDRAKWWNTKGQLGAMGSTVLRRGFPRTHHFAQARSTFAVAEHRCRELFEPPNCVTLWRLPASVEDELDARWEDWLDHASDWAPFFEKVQALDGTDLAAQLRSLDLVSDAEVERASKLRRSAEGRAVALPNVYSGSDEDAGQLALGFARGEPGQPAVPYARLENG